MAKQAVRAACDLQENDGVLDLWLVTRAVLEDSFHTGFNLDAIETYQQNTGDVTFQKYIKRGTAYYLEHFLNLMVYQSIIIIKHIL